MREIKSGERLFYTDSNPITIYGTNQNQVSIYPSGIERLFVEKEIKVSQISQAMIDRKEIAYLTWRNKFQISEGEVDFEEKKKNVPGILIRFSDSVDFEEKHPIPEGEGFDVYIGSVMRIAHLAEYIWSEINMSDTLNPKVYFAFNSRNNLPVHKDALTVKPEHMELERAVKKHFEDYIVADNGIIFEALTDGGLVSYSPDVKLLKNALDNGVNVGVSQFKLTNLAISSYIYNQLVNSTGRVREQFEERNKLYEERAELFRELGEAFKDVDPEAMKEFADASLELAESMQPLLELLQKELDDDESDTPRLLTE